MSISLEVRNAVMQMTDSELDDLFIMLKKRRSILNQMATVRFNVGDKVSFPGKYNRPTEGIVQQINKTTLKVKVENYMNGELARTVIWTVPSGMLTVLKKGE